MMRQPIIWQIFRRKMHENEGISTGGSYQVPLDPPLKTTFATKGRTKQYGYVWQSCNLSILCETFLLMKITKYMTEKPGNYLWYL